MKKNNKRSGLRRVSPGMNEEYRFIYPSFIKTTNDGMQSGYSVQNARCKECESMEKRAEYANRRQRACNKEYNNTSSILPRSVPESLSEMGLDNLLRTGKVDIRQLFVPRHPPLSNETYGTIPNQQQSISAEYLQAVKWLHEIFVMRQSESANYADDLPTSFVRVEKEIARCISECLADVPARMRSASYIQSLVRAYRVVQPLPGERHSVSLRKVHLILQDNFEGSCFCKLLNILLAGFMGSETKTIDF